MIMTVPTDNRLHVPISAFINEPKTEFLLTFKITPKCEFLDASKTVQIC